MDGQAIQSKMTFAGHVHELRKRLTWPALLLVIGGLAAYVFHNPIIDFLRAPLHQNLYYNTPAGGFNFVMKVCFIVGITLAVPALIYNIVSFIEPAVSKTISRRMISLVTLLSLTLGLAGAAFAYYAVLPMSLHFFGGFSLNGITPLISADDYLNFALTCILTFILLFQVPLLVLFINHIKPMSPRKLLKYEKYVIVGSLAIALVLPFTYDPLTQFLIAVPIIVLYNLSVIMVWFANRKHRRQVTSVSVPQAEMRVMEPTIIEPEPQPAGMVVEAEPPAPQPVVAKASSPVHQKTTKLPKQPTLQQVGQSVSRRIRPVFDIAPSPISRQNFLDLRPSK